MSSRVAPLPDPGPQPDSGPPGAERPGSKSLESVAAGGPAAACDLRGAGGAAAGAEPPAEGAAAGVLGVLRQERDTEGCEGWTHAAVVFDRRGDGSKEPILVAKKLLMSGKSSKADFQSRKLSTKVFAAESLYMKGVKVVTVATRGLIVNTMGVTDKADTAAPPEVDDVGDDFASHFVRLKIDKAGRRTFDPPKLWVAPDQVVHFSWHAEKKPLKLLQADEAFNIEQKTKGIEIVDRDGDRECNFKLADYNMRAGDYVYLVCDQYPTARMQISVKSAITAGILRISWQLAVLVIAAILLAILAYVTVDYIEDSSFVEHVFDCKGLASYCDGPVKQLKDYIFDTAAVPIFCACAIVVLGIPATIINLLWPAPTLSSFREGFHCDVALSIRIVSSVFLILPFVFVVADWVLISKYTWAITDILHVFGAFVNTLLDDVLNILLSTDSLFEVASKLESVGLGSVPDPSIIDTIINYEALVRGYTQLGVDLLATMILTRLIVNFLCLLCVVVSLAYGFAGLVRRSHESLHTSCWTSVVALAAMLWLLGFSAFFNELWLDAYKTYTGPDAIVNAPAGSGLPLAVTILSSCGSDATATIPVGALAEPLVAVLAGLGGSNLIAPAGPVTAADVQEFSAEVETQVQSLVYWMSQPDARIEEFAGALIPGISLEEFRTVLEGGLDIIAVLEDTVQCQQISPFLGDVQRILDQKVLPASQGVVFVERALVVLLVLWAIVAKVAAYVFLRPRKIYKDRVSRRWFRFKFSYLVSVKLRMTSVGYHFFEHRVEGYWWNTLEFLHGVLLLNTVMVAVLFTGGCMLLFLDTSTNPTWEWVVAGSILLMASSVLGFVGGWRNLGATHNRVLRGVSLLVVAAGTACLAYSAADNVARQVECHERIGYDPAAEGPTARAAFETTSAATQSAWSLALTGQGLGVGDRVLLTRGAEGCPPAGGSDSGAQSGPATSYGRTYPFDVALGGGVYGLCWCSAADGCAGASSHRAFAGYLYVDEPVDRFRTCTLEIVAGLSQVAFTLVVMLPFCLLRMVLATATLFRCVFSAHITDRQRRTAAGAGEPRAGAAAGPLRRLGPRQRLLVAGMLLLLVAGVASIFVVSKEPGARCYTLGGCEVIATTTTPPPPVLQSCPGCCNLYEATCDKRVDQAAFPTVHNAMSSTDRLWNFPNNMINMEQALSAGMRGLMLDLYYRWEPNATASELAGPGTVFLCHGYCGLGNMRFIDALIDIKTFLDDNPKELVVFILEQYVASYSVIKDLINSGMMEYCCYGHPSSSDEWPTVGQLISNNKRLLLFSNRAVSYTGSSHDGNILTHSDFGSDFVSVTSVDWWHKDSDYLAATTYSYTSQVTMTSDCSLNSDKSMYPIADFAETSQSAAQPGPAAYRLIVANHFISNPLPCESCAASSNQNTSLKSRMLSCKSQWDHQPNFPTVDFWSLGEVVRVSGHLNEQ